MPVCFYLTALHLIHTEKEEALVSTYQKHLGQLIRGSPSQFFSEISRKFPGKHSWSGRSTRIWKKNSTRGFSCDELFVTTVLQSISWWVPMMMSLCLQCIVQHIRLVFKSSEDKRDDKTSGTQLIFINKMIFNNQQA